jgi:PAS domain S-box-containing protein
MVFHYIMLPAIFGTIVSLFIAVYALRRRPTEGAGLFAVIMFGVAIWSFGSAIEAGMPDLMSMYFWAKFQYFGILVVPTSCLVFSLKYTGRSRQLTPRNHVLLSIVPTVTSALVWTNEYHGLIWRDVWVVTSGPVPLLDTIHGPAFWFHTAYSYLVLIAAAALLLLRFFASLKMYRKQAITMVLAIALPMIGNALYIAGVASLPRIDLTPFTFTLVGLIMAFGLFRFRLLDIVPIARNVVIETMNDVVVILDAQNRVVDLNPSAARLCALKPSDAIGKPVEVVIPELGPSLETIAAGDTPTEGEIAIGENHSRRHFNLHVSPLIGSGNRTMGQVLNLYDVTEKREAEEALQRSEFANRALLEAIPDLIVRVHRDGRILDLVLPAASVRTVTADQYQDMTLDDLPRLLFENLPVAVIDVGRQKLEQAMRDRKPSMFDFDLEVEGKQRYYETRIVLSAQDEAIVIVRDTTDRQQAEEAREKEMLLMETHHRVKNNLQVVSSLLYLQSRDIKDERILQMFKDSQNRVRTMALIHEQLYQSDEHKGVDFGGYVGSLSKSLVASYTDGSGNVELVVDTQPVALGLDKATPCGLIVNEIISNCLKHAFPGNADGEIRVSLSVTETEPPVVRLIIADNGVGIPVDSDQERPRTLGLTLIKTLTEQINGELEIDRSHGTQYSITFGP